MVVDAIGLSNAAPNELEKHIGRIYDVILGAVPCEFRREGIESSDEKEAAILAKWDSINERVGALFASGAFNTLPVTIIADLFEAGFKIVPITGADQFPEDQLDDLFHILAKERPASEDRFR